MGQCGVDERQGEARRGALGERKERVPQRSSGVGESEYEIDEAILGSKQEWTPSSALVVTWWTRQTHRLSLLVEDGLGLTTVTRLLSWTPSAPAHVDYSGHIEPKRWNRRGLANRSRSTRPKLLQRHPTRAPRASNPVDTRSTHGRIVAFPGRRASPCPSCTASPCEGCASCRSSPCSLAGSAGGVWD
jgi:hypothetical protein